MKRVFETAECEAVINSIFWELRYEKHKNQMKGCAVELRVSGLQMNEVDSGADLGYSRQCSAAIRYVLRSTIGYHSNSCASCIPNIHCTKKLLTHSLTHAAAIHSYIENVRARFQYFIGWLLSHFGVITADIISPSPARR